MADDGVRYQSANKAGVRVWLNPAPAREVPHDVLPLIDTLIVNETEAEVVSGLKVEDAVTADAAAASIIGRGTSNVIITLGEQGSFYGNAKGERFTVPAFRVTPVDTTAAGDTFIGAYAAACTEGLKRKRPFSLQLQRRTEVTRPGAQAYTVKEEIMAFINK